MRHTKITRKFLAAAYVLWACVPALPTLTACNPEYGAAFAQGFLEGMSQSRQRSRASSSTKLMLYGGRGHKAYLGCLNCSDIATDSIHNDIGKYGSSIGRNSIWNSIGRYGSEISQYSPWNELAQYPPVIVDQNGNFYGYFTINKLHPRRTTVSAIVSFLNSAERDME